MVRRSQSSADHDFSARFYSSDSADFVGSDDSAGSADSADCSDFCYS